MLLPLQAFSRVVQKLIPQLPTLENLLNILISVRTSGHELSTQSHYVGTIPHRTRALRKLSCLMW